MPAGIVTRGVILRALGGYMRTFNRFPPRTLRFRPLLILMGALLLMSALAPRANAALAAYFNFQGTPTPPYPVNMQSKPPAFFSTTMTTNYSSGNMVAESPGLPANVAPGDVAPNNTALQLRRSSMNDPANFDIPLFTAQGFFQNMTVSLAILTVAGNGFATATLMFSTNGGATFTTASSQPIPTSLGVLTFAVPAAANNSPLLVLRIQLTGGGSNGNNRQTVMDNIQVNGTIVPEPATVAGGLLGVLGLCWHQRRRLIRSVRFRRT